MKDGTTDRRSIAKHTTGFADYEAHLRALDWAELERVSGISREVIEKAVHAIAIGRERTGLCPVRGHSNVQGDRTLVFSKRWQSSFSTNWSAGSWLRTRTATTS